MSLWREGVPQTSNPLKFFLFVSKPHRTAAIIATSAVAIGSLLSTAVPYIFKLIVDAIATMSVLGVKPLLFAAGSYIVINTLKELVWRGSGYAGSFWALGVRATSRDALTAYVTRHSRAYFSDHFAGSIANKINHASSGVRGLVEKFLWQFLGFFVSLISSFALMFWVSPIIGILFIGWIIISISFNIHRAKKRVPLSIAGQKLETELTGNTVDLLTNIGAMQEYARRDFEIKNLQDKITERRRRGLVNWHFGELTLTINGLLQAVFETGAILTMVYLAQKGTISAGDVILVITLIYRLDDQFLFLGSHINELGEQWGEIRESLEEIVVPHEVTDSRHASQLRVREGSIDFSRVTFLYGKSDREVLRQFSLAVPGRQKVGLVGKSGAGKSTLVKLLLRHYEINAGEIAIDGQNISEVTQDSLRQAISIVPQEPLLFHRTLRENIAYGKPDATDFEIINAAKLAQAHEFISSLPQGYDTLVGERGVKLSGGERQRVAIARAILKNAPILVLDEATASLDSESEVAIQKALHELMQGKTVIAIAHRLSTLREMDRIIVLDQGQINEEGTHDELIAQGGVYAELWKHQAGGFLQDE